MILFLRLALNTQTVNTKKNKHINKNSLFKHKVPLGKMNRVPWGKTNCLVEPFTLLTDPCPPQLGFNADKEMIV